MVLARLPPLVQISLAHFISHVHIIAVASVIPFLPEKMGVSYTDIGLSLVLFNLVSMFVQTPIGYAVDRWGGRRMLLAALFLGSAGYMLLAVYPSFAMLLFAMCLAGFANGIYHPADYSLLSRHIAIGKMGRAFSYHTFAGFVGTAITPACMIAVASAAGVGSAFASAALCGFLVFGIIVLNDIAGGSSVPSANTMQSGSGRSPFLERLWPIAVLFVLFVFLSLASSAIDKFAITAFVTSERASLATATMSITAFLGFSAAGVLAGGYIADRTKHHGMFGACSFLISALLVAYVIIAQPAEPVMIAFFGLAGFASGVVAPSRDMLVRAIAPAGSEGKLFGFVTTGFNVGSLIGPLGFGLLLDRGFGSMVLWSGVAAMAFASLTMLLQESPLYKRSQH